MKSYTTYDPTSGEITGLITLSTDLPSDMHAIAGIYAKDEYYIKNSQPVKKSAKPSAYHEWDFGSESWQLHDKSLIDQMRAQRQYRLRKIDQINPVWWTSLTTEQQQQLQNYRQALLDVPQQAGWPHDIAWPSVPTWLP